jgi:iron-sulfur cluster assembly protein
MIKITDAAAEQIRAANNNPDVFEMILRVAAYQEDDGSVNYGMGFDTERADDEHLIVNGIQLLIAPGSTPYLQGVTLDFVELNPGDMRFIFIPPYSAEDAPADATPAE